MCLLSLIKQSIFYDIRFCQVGYIHKRDSTTEVRERKYVLCKLPHFACLTAICIYDFKNIIFR